MRRLGLVLCAVGVWAGCRTEPPLPPDRLVPVLVDLHLATARAHQQALLQPGLPDTLRPAVLAQHGLDSTRFAAAMAYYADHPDDGAALYDSVLARLTALQSTLPAVPTP